MKLSKITFIVGVFFLFMQFSTVILFNQMLTISKNQGLPFEQIAELQGTIMSIILFSLIAFGILFMVLLLALIRSAFKQSRELLPS
ncbi:hypothetical protein [Paenibacillus validus]|uniref:hypothetical protein n=1 Tax=Paenibacillus validus TaxID=44253 RepID=UPI003D2C4ABB